MTLRQLLTVLFVASAATFSTAPIAFADAPASDAAQTCAEGPQIDYYQAVAGAEDAAPAIDFGNLTHGSDEIGPYVIAADHGDCVSFIAKNTKGDRSNTNGQEYLKIELKVVLISG